MINKFKLSLILTGFIAMPLAASYAEYGMNVDFTNFSNTTLQVLRDFNDCVTDQQDPNPMTLISGATTTLHASAQTGGDCSWKRSQLKMALIANGQTVGHLNCQAYDGSFQSCAPDQDSHGVVLTVKTVNSNIQQVYITPANPK